MEMLVNFAEMGTYLDYDLFGIETSYYQQVEDSDMPSDAERMNRIAVLIKAGFQDRVTIAQDIHTKHRLVGERICVCLKVLACFLAAYLHLSYYAMEKFNPLPNYKFYTVPN